MCGLILALTVSLGSTAQACSAEDCPGNLYGSAGETFVHYKDNIYVVFDDGRNSLVGFDAQYDYYTVFVMVGGQLLDAGTMDAYAGTVTDIQPTLTFKSLAYTGSVAYVQVQLNTSQSIAYWRIRWNPVIDSASKMADYLDQGHPVIIYDAYSADGSYIDTAYPQTEYVANFRAAFSSKPNQIYSALRSAVTTGRFFPEKMSDETSAEWEIDVNQYTPADEFLPSRDTSDNMYDVSDAISSGVSDIKTEMPYVDRDDVTDLFPDVSSLDNDVLANVRILTTGIYDTNVVTLLTTSLGMAIIGYLLFGKKES